MLPVREVVHTDIHRIQMGRDYHRATKVDRSPAFLEELRTLGHEQARAFLADNDR